jgi:type IV pilus assembly protein PilW
MFLKLIRWHDGRKRCQSGYTLVEILVVMLISFIVLGGVYQAITRESIELDKEEIILDMQLNARAALDIIAGDIRKAGFLGCTGTLAADTTSNTGTADPLQTMTGIGDTNLPIIDALNVEPGGVNYLGDPLAYVNDVAGGHVTYQEGTDVLSVRYLDGDAQLETAMADGTVTVDLPMNDFKRADILYITDCEFYSLFQKTNCSPTPSAHNAAHALADTCPSETDTPVPDGNTTIDLGKAYGENARVYKLVINTYFIQDGSFAISQNSTGTDIVKNIEDLQFQYKWDANGNNDLADDPWIDDPIAGGVEATEIREIKIYVLARSEPVYSYTNNNLYVYPNSPYDTTAPGDNYYRYLASAVVTLRNSGL